MKVVGILRKKNDLPQMNNVVETASPLGHFQEGWTRLLTLAREYVLIQL